MASKGKLQVRMIKQHNIIFFSFVIVVIFIACMFPLSPCAWANSGDQYSANIAISGTVVVNGSCTFNQEGTVTVDFGTVKLTGGANNSVTLDGEYKRPLTSDFQCSGDSAGLLQMQFTSTSGAYETYNGTKVLGTDKGIVAIQLLVNGEAKNMGEWFTIDQNSPPSLQAELVQVSTTNTNNVTSGDVFAASGTLIMAFN